VFFDIDPQVATKEQINTLMYSLIILYGSLKQPDRTKKPSPELVFWRLVGFFLRCDRWFRLFSVAR
jgi:hypothetical protein